MPSFEDIDVTEFDRLWEAQATATDRRNIYASQMVDLQPGVPRVLTNIRADLSKVGAIHSVRNNIRNALKKLGYDHPELVRVLFHEGQVIVCVPFAGEVPRRAPTLAPLDDGVSVGEHREPSMSEVQHVRAPGTFERRAG